MPGDEEAGGVVRQRRAADRFVRRSLPNESRRALRLQPSPRISCIR
ncbi:MAG TPA: hypothetical protein VGG02_09705 [Chthoniobacterales bacterium]